MEEQITGSVSAILKSLECAICLELLKNPVSTGCGHFFCRFCITETLQSEYQKPCPLCKKSFTRRSICEAIQRKKVIDAAKKLGEICGKAIGVNFFPKENTQKENRTNFSDLKEILTGQEAQILLQDVVKSKKRKSDEILLNGEADESENLISLKKLQNQNVIKEVDSSADEAIPPTTKRYCQAVSDDDDDDSEELPSLANLFKAAGQQANINSESKDKANVEALITGTETDKKSEEKGFIIKRKTSKSTSRKKNEVTLKNRENVMALKNKTNHANDFEKECAEVINKKFSENMEISKEITSKISKEIFCENDEICKENKKNFGTLPNKYKPNKVLSNSKKKSRKSKLCVSNSSADEDDLNSKIKEAENHTLVIEKNNEQHALENTSQECHELTEIEIPGRETTQPQETNIKAHQKNSKTDEISDTVVSVHTFASPQLSKGNLASKSPGWSRVKNVRKDFKVKKFSRLSVQKNSSMCPVEEISNVGEKSCETLDKQFDCNEISETVPVKEDSNQSSSPAKVMSMDEDEPMLEVPETIKENAIEDNVNQMNQKELILNMEKNENTRFSLPEAQSSKFAESCNLVEGILQPADDGVPCNERVRNDMNAEINLRKETDIIEEPIPMDTCFQVPDSDISEANLYPSRYFPSCSETTKENSSICEKNLANTELNSERIDSKKNDNICKTPVSGLIKESRASKISKVTKGNMSPESNLPKDVFYVEHSQQTSQRIDFYDAKNQNESFVPAALQVEVPRYHAETFTSRAILPCPISIPWFCNKENVTSEKTKVVKRTCLTLDEIQDYFTKSTFSGKPETVCSLPFLSDSYKLHITVADDTLNISVLKVVDSNTSEMHYTKTSLINFPETSNLHQKTNSVLMSEKSAHTSTNKYQSPTVLPSSNAESDCSEVDDNSEVVKHKTNPFPFLNKFFSDSESTPQMNEVSDACNVSCVPDTYNVKDIYDASVAEDMEKSNVKHASDVSNVKHASDVSNVKDIPDTSNITKDNSEIFVLPPSRKSSYKFPVQIEETPNNIETETNVKEALDSNSNHLKDSANTLMNSKASLEKNRNLNSSCAPGKKLEMVDISSQDSMDQDADCSILKNSPPTTETTVNPRKELDSDSSEESYKKALCDDDDFLKELSDLNHCQTSSHYARLMRECDDALSSDPAMAYANDLVAPLKNIANKLKSVSQESNKNQNKLTADPKELNKSLDMQETKYTLENVLNLLPNHKSLFSNTNTKQKVSRLSLKKKKKGSKFKRIQNDSDSDSDELESSKIDEVTIEKSSKPTSPLHKNVSTASFQEQSTLNSLLSDDANSSQIVKEIEDIDQKIRSVEEKLKMCGHANLLSEENNLLLKDMPTEECSTHEESEDSDDLFSQSIPPTPPEAVSISRDSTFKKPRLNY